MAGGFTPSLSGGPSRWTHSPHLRGHRWPGGWDKGTFWWLVGVPPSRDLHSLFQYSLCINLKSTYTIYSILPLFLVFIENLCSVAQFSWSCSHEVGIRIIKVRMTSDMSDCFEPKAQISLLRPLIPFFVHRLYQPCLHPQNPFPVQFL